MSEMASSMAFDTRSCSVAVRDVFVVLVVPQPMIHTHKPQRNVVSQRVDQTEQRVKKNRGSFMAHPWKPEITSHGNPIRGTGL